MSLLHPRRPPPDTSMLHPEQDDDGHPFADGVVIGIMLGLLLTIVTALVTLLVTRG